MNGPEELTPLIILPDEIQALSVYDVLYTVTVKPRDSRQSERRTEGTLRVLAPSGLAAAMAVRESFPLAWWSSQPECRDSITVDAVTQVCAGIRLEVRGPNRASLT